VSLSFVRFVWKFEPRDGILDSNRSLTRLLVRIAAGTAAEVLAGSTLLC
jgi:hypothetical protein